MEGGGWGGGLLSNQGWFSKPENRDIEMPAWLPLDTAVSYDSVC
jgi:hypothetical protein